MQLLRPPVKVGATTHMKAIAREGDVGTWSALLEDDAFMWSWQALRGGPGGDAPVRF